MFVQAFCGRKAAGGIRANPLYHFENQSMNFGCFHISFEHTAAYARARMERKIL